MINFVYANKMFNQNRNKMKIDKSVLFRIANAMYHSHKAATISDALRMVWKAAKLQIKLAAGEVRFQYRKINGEIRQAVGTLKNMVDENTSAFNSTAMFYFDVEKRGFRSFAIANLI